MYSAAASRSKPRQSDYSLQGPISRPIPHLSAPHATSPASPRELYSLNGSVEGYAYGHAGNSHVRLPSSNSRQYSSATLSAEDRSSSSVYYQPQCRPQHSHSNNGALYVAEGYGPRDHNIPDVIPSLSRRFDNPAPLNTSVSIASHSGVSRDSSSVITPSSEYSLPIIAKESPPVTLPKRKPRREKPKITLAPDQPPTTQGRPRARVFVACLQCRNRKIRCDGAKPVCHNCGRRSGNKECNYDSVPRRRGPDKIPGARQRMARELKEELDSDVFSSSRRRRRRRDTSSTSASDQARSQTSAGDRDSTGKHSQSDALLTVPVHGSLSPASSSDLNASFSTYLPSSGLLSSPLDIRLCGECACHSLFQCPNNSSNVHFYPKSVVQLADIPRDHHPGVIADLVPQGYIVPVVEGDPESGDVKDISRQPSLEFTKKIWFDSLCSLYVSIESRHLRHLSNVERDQASQDIASDLRFLFRVSNYWFSFFHIPSFFGNYYDPVKRERTQPSLVLAALALSTFWQSSDVGHGRVGRARALRLRDEAQSALEASFNTGWIDETLAQAGWLLALFEVCAHPQHSTERTVSSMVMLDSIIRSLSLTTVDDNDPQTSRFQRGDVPAVPVDAQRQWSPASSSSSSPSFPVSSQTESGYSQYTPSTGSSGSCNCNSLTLGAHWPQSLQHTPMWATTPTWNPSWSEAEIRRESCRRLCWSTLALAAGRVSYYAIHRFHEPELFISDPANYALLFSGESIISLGSSKDSIWALHDRAFLLWHICVKMRHNMSISDVERAQFALKAWLEADAIEAALNKHTCAIEKAYIFHGREYLFNIRMCISYEFQRFIPIVSSDINSFFHRGKVEEWLTHQAAVAQRFMHGLHTITGNSNNLLAHRPFFVFWFMSQVARALSLWECDKSLTVALDVCKAFLPPINYLSALWPCHGQRHRYERLRERLNAACYAAGVSLPPPPDFTLPDPSSPQSLV